ncbi:MULTISPECIES: fluoride efflux transporter CrcB [Lysobacter]|uniref:Fluoride-specific ion channel FluC n=1 Tax=Lysobacter yananisis TaxID=1003114 RepID=A0ABY9P4W5_9GAMM|nr:MULTISPECIES: fluoride efflux transporter CrcB [Lysobacter]QQQ03655.1 fluoride efflux transporter CrcB [Lysobacter enzymogenes]WMT02075.1 fluoride efflux transporter CrcB [Lysobacter yananisis]
MSAVSIFIGAGLGALLRWWLGLALNPLFPTVPMGTLAANALGGLLMGVLMAVFAQYETLPLALRLALTTGFLGGLTTFSTFSAETSSLLLRGEYGWAGAIVAAHVGASLLATLAGVMAVRGLLRWLAGAAA